MKMTDVFDVGSFNVYHYAEIVDTSRYAYIEHNEIQIENSEYIDYAVQNHDRLVDEVAELREFVRMVADHDDVEYSDKLLMVECFIQTAKTLLNKTENTSND